ncbi:hypothetical protein CDV36_001710 [Fusarium kuroshium]|uniref:Uncharacterized protein n=1 Tax=Fusarium kuroshium TaxID=2010991 RepID=A0A3M2SM41_9HYPO|nr:hypothetical protein CDV36_001710 [Fusarium kuroshium]
MQGPYGFTQNTVNMGTNPSSQGSARPSRTPKQAMMAQMPMLIRQNRVPEMAWLLLQACPGDWDCGWGPLVRSTLTRAIKRELSEKELTEAAATIRFRWELALYADHLVKTFGLQVPGGEVCILWDFGKWRAELARGQHRNHSFAWDMVVRGGIKPNLLDHDGYPFDRFLHYVVAAVTLMDLPEDMTRALATIVVKYTAGEQGFLQQRARARRAT